VIFGPSCQFYLPSVVLHGCFGLLASEFDLILRDRSNHRLAWHLFALAFELFFNLSYYLSYVHLFVLAGSILWLLFKWSCVLTFRCFCFFGVASFRLCLFARILDSFNKKMHNRYYSAQDVVNRPQQENTQTSYARHSQGGIVFRNIKD
jgi:hypothetical protein